MSETAISQDIQVLVSLSKTAQSADAGGSIILESEISATAIANPEDTLLEKNESFGVDQSDEPLELAQDSLDDVIVDEQTDLMPVEPLEKSLSSIDSIAEAEELDRNLQRFRDGSIESLGDLHVIEPIQTESAAGPVLDAYQFKIALVSEDRIPLVSLVDRLTTSPPPRDTGFVFSSADVENYDALVFGLTCELSRAGTPQESAVDLADIRERDIVANALLPSTPEPVVMPEPAELPTDETSQAEAGLTYEPPVVVEQVVQIDREAIIARIKEQIDLKEKQTTKGTFLQNKVAEYFKRKRPDDARDGEKSALDQEQRFDNCMAIFNQLRGEYSQLNTSNQKQLEETSTKLQDRAGELKSKAAQFRSVKRSVATSAENSRTGKSLAPKSIDQLEQSEKKKEMDVTRVRLENIKLRNKLRRHEQLLRQKEELADGLHLIDFEQLKIENQTYNEKIEERNEELLKLRRKITNVVQNETQEFKQGLKTIDAQVASKRDVIPTLKQTRDAIRDANTILRQKNGLLGNSNLLRDYGNKVEDAKQLNDRIESLKDAYGNLIFETQQLRKKMQKQALVSQLSHDLAPAVKA